MTKVPAFRARVVARERLIGTFIKTPADHPIEIIGGQGFDFIVIDAEHAPFDRCAVDRAVLAAKAVGVAALVRLHSTTPQDILAVLDCGAQGILAPHVTSAAKAREIVSACRYRKGSRGFSNSPRAGLYGRVTLADHIAFADRNITVVVQIEDPEALDQLDEIAGIDGVDALFVGRGDLSVALDVSGNDAPEIVAATQRVARAAQKAGKPLSVFSSNPRDGADMAALGATLFVVGSDQSFLAESARNALGSFRSLGVAHAAGAVHQ